MKPPQRILVVGVDWLGDVIFSTPLIRSLRKKYPHAHIAYSTSSACTPILDQNPHLNQVLAFDERPFVWGLFNNISFVIKLKRHRFDMAIFLHRSATRAFLCWLAGIKQRIGYQRKKRAGWMTATHPLKQHRHRIDIYLGSALPLELPDCGREVEVFLGREDKTHICQAYGLELDKYVAIHMGGNWSLKRWPVAHYIQVIKDILALGFKVVLCGTRSERDLSNAISAQLADTRVISACGRTTLSELATLFKRSRLVLSGDSGPLHLASGLGVPLVALFGPTAADETGPVGRGAINVLQQPVGCVVPCYFQRCHHQLCMQNLKPPRVLKTLEPLLS